MVESNKVDDFKNICRICSSDGENLYDLIENEGTTELGGIFTACLGIEVSETFCFLCCVAFRKMKTG